MGIVRRDVYIGRKLKKWKLINVYYGYGGNQSGAPNYLLGGKTIEYLCFLCGKTIEPVLIHIITE